jgi:hypothetical protein
MAWYFRHDYKARNDVKIIELEIEFGHHVGYSLWFRLLETMGESGGKLSKAKLKLYAHMIGIDFEELDKFVKFCVGIGLLQEEDGFVFNLRFSTEYEKIKATSEKNSINAKERWSLSGGNANAEANAKPKPKPDIVKNPVKTPKKEPVPDSPDTDEITAVRDEITAMLQHAENTTGVKPGNKKSTLSNREIETLIEKFGLSTLLVMVDVFYLWKLTSKRIVSSDYLSMLQSWVQERAEKQINGNGNCKQQIKQQSSEDFSMYRL